MTRGSPMTDVPIPEPRGLPSRWLATAILVLDSWLRRVGEVQEYTANTRCVFRIQIDHLDCAVALSDGTWLAAGDRIINLHLWNEQFPGFGSEGASVTWASRLTRRVEISLRELCRFLAVTPEFDDVVAICADMTLGTARETRQLITIAARFGFEAVDRRQRRSIIGRVHCIGENILVSMLVLAHNAEALRRDSLFRDRTRIILHRSVLERRYGLSQARGRAH
jgi:hypothetical protein